jgi:acetyl esterase/lipase
MAVRGRVAFLVPTVGGIVLLGLGVAMASAPVEAAPGAPVESHVRNTTTETSLSYGPSTLQTVSVFSGPSPNGSAVVLVHGGGFRSSVNDAKKLAINARSLVAYGDTVFDVNYRSDVDGVGIADQVADVVAGSQLAIVEAPSFGADTDRLSVIGGSSGGLLAADAAEELNDIAPHTVQTVVTLSGTADFTTALAYWETVVGPPGQVHIKDLTGTLGCTVVTVKHVKTYDCPAPLEAQYSPDQQVTPTNCANQWLILNGTDEVQPTSQAVAMDGALVAQGCPQTLDVFTDTAHSYDYWSAELKDIQAAVAAA